MMLRTILLAFLGVSASSAAQLTQKDITDSPRGNLRRQLKDDSANIVTMQYKGVASVSLTTKNDWVEEGINFVHIRARFNNVDKEAKPICGITFSIEGFNAADPRTQYGNFEVLSNGSLFIPGSTDSANPLHYKQLAPDTRPDWFVGVIMPFVARPGHDFPEVRIQDVQFCAPGQVEAPATTTTKVTAPTTTTATP